jgi:hypothetical protein
MATHVKSHNNPKQNLELVVCVYAMCIGHIVGIPSSLQSRNQF